MRNRWKMRKTLRIRKAVKPIRKKKGRMVKRSTIPSKDRRKRKTAFPLGRSG